MELGLRTHSNRVALELIDVQDSSFGLQLEAIVEGIRNDILKNVLGTYTDLLESQYPKQLTEAIFKRTGLKIELIVSKDPAAILSFYSNRHHIFVNPAWRGEFTLEDQQKIISQAHNKKGYVDLKKAKVGGLFSEYSNILYINFHSLVKNYQLTTREIVSVILHELGHAFYVCEFSDRLESTNQILSNVAKEVISGKGPKNLEYIYKELKTIDDKITPKDVDDIVNGNHIIAGYKLFRSTFQTVVSQMSNSKYDETAFEQVADHFATRFGYSRDLITALDKMHDYFNDPQKSQTYTIFNTILSTLSLAFVTLGLFSAILSGAVVTGFYLSFYIWSLFFLAREDVQDYTYDKLKIRYKRIRNNYVEVLKTLDLSKEDKQSIVNNIYKVDEIISNTYIQVSIFNKISNVVFSKARQADKAIREQQLLEELAFNDVYIKATELSTVK